MIATRYLIILAAAALAACTPEGLGPEQRSDRLRGVIDADLAVTKSILVDNPGVKLESFWEAGDQIGVFGGSAENALFSLKAEDLSTDRKTADFSTDGTIPGGKLTAYAPYQKEAKKDGDAIVVTFPARQSYVTYNGVVQPDPAANILLGEGSKAGGLTFRNLTAVLKIGQVFEQETLVKSVEFRDLSGAAVTGAMKLTGGTSPKAEITRLIWAKVWRSPPDRCARCSWSSRRVLMPRALRSPSSTTRAARPSGPSARRRARPWSGAWSI